MSFYLHNSQKVRVDKTTGNVIFHTRTMGGCVYYFPLTFDQFMAFNDVIALICNVKRLSKSHYPLGQNLWFYYNSHDASFYDNGKTDRLYFRFYNFHLYLTRLHHKLLSFLRNEEGERASGGKRRKHLIANRLRYNGESCDDKISNRKRPLSIVVQPKTESEASREHCEKWDSLSCTSNNAILSHTGQADAVLPEWNDTNSRWRNDSKTTTMYSWKDLPSPEAVCIGAATHSFEPMDSD